MSFLADFIVLANMVGSPFDIGELLWPRLSGRFPSRSPYTSGAEFGLFPVKHTIVGR